MLQPLWVCLPKPSQTPDWTKRNFQPSCNPWWLGVILELLYFDMAVRGAATAVSVLLVAMVWGSRITREAQLAFTFLVMVTTCNMWSKVGPVIGLPDVFLENAKYLNVCATLAMTWFAVVIFLDDRRFSWAWYGSAVAIAVAILCTPNWPEIIPFLRVYAGLHFVALLVLVLWSAQGDLQDARRRVRPLMAAFLLIYCLGQAATARPMQDMRTLDVQIWQASTFLAFLFIFAIWSLKTNVAHWPGKVDPHDAAIPTPAQVTSEQTILVGRIQAQMAEGVWRSEGLTVGELAGKVGAPEHQVRKAINQVLGHRNFASFINAARVEAAKQRLGDRDALGVTVLEVAFDVGFSSLGPFNRAFREKTGVSPTEFRKTALDAPV